MKNLIILAVFATGLLLNLQETKAQKATKAQKPNAPLTNTEVYTQNQMQFMEKNCPDCENGNYINSEGRCCCSEIDGACGKILTHDQIQFASWELEPLTLAKMIQAIVGGI